MKKTCILFSFVCLTINLFFVSCSSSTGSETENAATVALSGLSLSSVTISPAFSTATTAYTASVANAVSSVTVTLTVADSGLSVTVQGTALTLTGSGASYSGASGAVTLNVGDNAITIVVSRGTESKTYTVTVTRAIGLSGLSLSSVTLSPTFAEGTTAYTASVANSVSSTAVTATVAESSYAITVKGTALTLAASGSGYAGSSGTIALGVGSNEIPVIVSSGSLAKTYTVNVTRAGVPNIQVTGPTSYGGVNTTLTSGTGISFGNVTLTPREISITLLSTGTGVLTLTGTSPNYITVSGSSCYTIPTQPTSSTIPPGENRTFVIRFTTNQSWITETATVTVLSDDEEDGTFTLSLTGVAQC